MAVSNTSSTELSESARTGIIITASSIAFLVVLFGSIEVIMRKRRKVKHLEQKERELVEVDEDEWRCLG